jgi:hypothetical protein
MGDGVQERIANNNLTFREANEKIRSKADEYDAPLERIPFLCECPLPGCLQIVRLTLDEYSGVRANPRYFLTVPGHEQAERPLGRVVSRQDGYVVVEKDVDIAAEEA